MPDPLSPFELVLVALSGGAVGIVAGVFGVGGGFLLVPVLNVLLGVPIEFAVGAGACQALGPATTSLLYRGVDRHVLRFPLVMLGGLVAGVVAGGMTLDWASHLVQPASSVPGAPRFVERLVLWVYLALLLGLGLFATWESWRTSRGNPFSRGWLRAIALPPYARFPEMALPRLSIPVLAWFGLGVGFVSGLIGISGGLLLLPGLVYLFGVPAQESVRCSLVVVWLVSAQATGLHAWNGFVDLWLVSALLLGGTIGARLGSEAGSRLGGARLRQRFGWLLLGAAAMVVWKMAQIGG
jgi:uncharacterized protein